MVVTMVIEMLFKLHTVRQTVLYLVLIVDVCSFVKEQLHHSFVPISRGYIERCGTILHKGKQ